MLRHVAPPEQMQAGLLKSDTPATLVAEASLAAQDPEQAMGGQVPLMQLSETLGLTPHKGAQTKSCASLASGIQMMFTRSLQIWDQHLEHITQ